MVLPLVPQRVEEPAVLPLGPQLALVLPGHRKVQGQHAEVRWWKHGCFDEALLQESKDSWKIAGIGT